MIAHHDVLYRDLADPVAFFRGETDTELARFWPYVFAAGQSEIYWEPGLDLASALRRYAVFYAFTSFWWDLLRAAGNFVLLLIFAAPVLRLLRRFQRRFFFEVGPA